jgi:hypothetical protein
MLMGHPSTVTRRPEERGSINGEIIRLLYVEHLDRLWGPQLPIQFAPETHSPEVKLYS